jgi:hypothetical protein
LRKFKLNAQITIEENDDILIRLNKNIVNPDSLRKFMDYLEFEAIRNASHLTEIQAELLTKEINSAVWENLQKNLSLQLK